jgi:HEAT repeat protein
MRTFVFFAVLAAALLARPALAQQNNQDTYNAALKSLQSAQPADRALGLVGLALIGTDGIGASREVVAALFDSSDEVRKQAATALSSVNPTLAGPVLTLVNGTDPDRKAQAVQALSKLGKDALPATPALLSFLGQAKGTEKTDVVKTLAAIGGQDPAMTAQIGALALKDADPVVRQAALQAIGKMSDPQSQVNVALDILNTDRTAQNRVNAAILLGTVGKGSTAAMQKLEAVAGGDLSPEVQAAAKKAIEQLKKK